MFSRNATYQERAKKYLDQQFNKELPRLAKKARHRIEHLDLDRDVLARAGLMRRSQSPGLGTALGLFALGGIAGGILALLWAPKTGAQTRSEVKQRAQGLMNQGKERMDNSQDMSNRGDNARAPHMQA
jgi:hypothetical protein